MRPSQNSVSRGRTSGENLVFPTVFSQVVTDVQQHRTSLTFLGLSHLHLFFFRFGFYIDVQSPDSGERKKGEKEA